MLRHERRKRIWNTRSVKDLYRRSSLITWQSLLPGTEQPPVIVIRSWNNEVTTFHTLFFNSCGIRRTITVTTTDSLCYCPQPVQLLQAISWTLAFISLPRGMCQNFLRICFPIRPTSCPYNTLNLARFKTSNRPTNYDTHYAVFLHSPVTSHFLGQNILGTLFQGTSIFERDFTFSRWQRRWPSSALLRHAIIRHW
jgi:hypothetical protein